MRNLVTKETLVFASIGLSIELLIVLLLGFGSRSDFLFPVGVSIFGLYLAAIVLGRLFGNVLDYRQLRGSRLFICGTLVAWSCLVIQVLFGLSVEFFRNIDHAHAFQDYVFKPIFWVVFLGTIPSLAVGALYTVRIKHRLSKIESVK